MLVLGLGVAARFAEEHFVPTRTRRWSSSRAIFVDGLALVRRSRVILVIFAATFLVNGASDAWGRLYPKQLLRHGFPTAPDPIVWFTALGIVGLLIAAIVLRMAQKRLEAIAARRDYALAALVGTGGLLLAAVPAGPALAGAATLLVTGVTVPLTRTISTIWVNAETTSDVRATVHSFLAQSEYLGELVCGLLLALLARAAGLGPAIVGCAVLFALTAALMLASGSGRRG
jgi:hypothetical protein